MKRRAFHSVAVTAAFALAAGSALAQNRPAAAGYPSKPVKLIVAAAAGSSPDAIGRQLATKLTAAWGQPVAVENVVGLGGITGTDRAAKQPPDGYTFVISTIGAMSVSASLMDKMPYDPAKDLAPVSLVMAMPNLLVVHPSVPARNVRELIDYAKQNPNKLRYGHPGVGTSPHLAAELLNHMAGLKLQGIPYKSSAQMTTDAIGGHYEVLFHNSSVVLPHAKNGALRVLAITSAERNASLPDVPTIAEAGNVAGFAVNAWWGMYAPAGTPQDIINKVSADVAAALNSPDVKTWVTQQGGVIGGGTPQALRAYQEAETVKWRDMIKAANIKAD